MVPSQSQAVGVMCQWGATAGGKGVVPASEDLLNYIFPQRFRE